jgi:tetratricopeptide (TPR) repeat protein
VTSEIRLPKRITERLMTSPPRAERLRTAVSLLLLIFAAAAGARAAEPDAAPWNAAPFSAEPSAMLKAADAVSVSGAPGVIVLAENVSFVYDATGRRDTKYRLVYRILSAAALKGWSSYEESWASWFQDKPQMRARVITAEGQALTLDPSTISDSPAQPDSPEVYTDRRVLRAPLPGVAVGAIVEEETDVHETKPVFDGGVARYVFFGRGAPTQRETFDVVYPKTLGVKIAVRTKPVLEPKRSEENGSVHLHFEAGPLEAIDYSEPSTPPDRDRYSYVGLATGKSWNAVASGYAEVVDRQISGASLADAAAEARSGGASTAQVIDRLVARLQRDVRYTGVEFSDASIVPRSPAETLQRRYGDCKDKAALLVALLRAAGIPASVALLRTGSGLDTDPDLPGLGVFDHAIVYVPGPPAIWIDATDEFAHPGELPLGDRGRLALVAAKNTSGLIETPPNRSADNRFVETREFLLQEYGPSRVIDSFELSGSFDRAYRRYLRQGEPKRIDDYFERYAKTALLADGAPKTTIGDPLDLSKPLVLRLEIAQSRRGQTDESTAAIAILPAAIVESFPQIFREAPDDNRPGKSSEPNSGPKPRKADYVFAEPAVTEWVYRVVPPAGYSAAPLPEGGTTAIGTATLSKTFTVEKDGSVTARIRLDTGKSRLTPDEFETMRKAVQKLQGAEVILVRFDSRGQADLNAGKLKEALTEFRALSCAHPKEAIHAIQTANALLQAGLGEAARQEARRATTLDPESARAYRTLGWVLQHDELGRRFGKGFDRPGAIEAYKKSIALDPSDVPTRVEYASLLEYDDRGVRFGPGANLEEAVRQYRYVKVELKEARIDEDLLVALVWTRHFDEVLETARDASPSATRDGAILLALAVTKGPDAAILESTRIVPDADKRRQTLIRVSETLLQMRLYPQSVALMREAANGASSAAAIQARAELIARAKRHEDVAADAKDPRSAVQRLIVAYHRTPTDHADDLRALFSTRTASGAFEEKGFLSAAATLESIQRPLKKEGFPLDAAADLMLATMELSKDGSDASGWLVRVVGAKMGDPDGIYFVVREGSGYRLAATGRNLAPVGLVVLDLADKGDLAGARQWLDWVRDEVTPAGPDDPYAGNCLPMFWQKGAKGDERAVRRAAACLFAATVSAPKAIPILKKDRDAATPEQRLADDWALAIAYLQTKQNAEALEAVAPVAAAHPESATVFSLQSVVLARLERYDALKALADDRLARYPGDIQALRVRGDVAGHAKDLAGYQRFYKAATESSKATPADFNNLAWITVFTGDPDGQGLRNAQRAVDLSQHEDAFSLHTLATIYAESGKTAEARQTILQAFELDETGEAANAMWSVVGRIAEQYGEAAAASDFYARVKAPEPPESSDYSAFSLAQKHLASLRDAGPARTEGCPEPPKAIAKSGS